MHTCPYPGCDEQVAVQRLACRRHWYTVSKPTRDRVWDTYRNRGGAGSAAHAAAVTDAVDEMRVHAERAAAGKS
jgi:hypothetical protein